jgi:hypothetical protein
MQAVIQVISSALLTIALDAYLLPFSLWLAGSWVRVWTRDLMPELRARRIKQIESHLFEVVADGKEKGVRPAAIGLTILVNTLLSIVGDFGEAGLRTDWSGLALSGLGFGTRALVWAFIQYDKVVEITDSPWTSRVLDGLGIVFGGALLYFQVSTPPLETFLTPLQTDVAPAFGVALHVFGLVLVLGFGVSLMATLAALFGCALLLPIYLWGPGNLSYSGRRERLVARFKEEAKALPHYEYEGYGCGTRRRRIMSQD